jgi:hypothetical protein
MIARSLAVAMVEAIRAHAERHHCGKMDRDRTLSALGDIASNLLADLTTREDRNQHYSALVQDIAQQTARKLADDMRLPTAH